MLSVPTIRILALSLVSLLVAASLAAAQGTNSLQGKVIAPNGMQPNSAVKVSLTLNGRRIHETFTDLSGRFYFPGLANGTYQLTAEGDGQTFQTTSVYAEVSAFRSAQLFTQDIQLRALAGKPLRPAGVVDAFTQDVPKAARRAMERAAKLTGELKTEAAVEQLLEAIKIFPQYFEAHLQLGNIFLKAGRLDQAIAELDKAREINPNDARAYQSFGLVLMTQKNYPVAVAVFSEASRLNPADPFNEVMIATALIHQAYALNPSSSDGMNPREYFLNKADLALKHASNLSDNKVRADHLTLAMFYEMKGDQARAAKELEEQLQANPTSRSADDLRNAIKRLRGPAGIASPPTKPRL